MKAKLIERFFRYVSADTQSDPASETVPSTSSQAVFLKELKRELEAVGLSDAVLDEKGYLTAVLPANSKKTIPSIGFIAHVDTSPDFSGKGVSPSIVKAYDGGDILLNAEKNILLSPSDFPELKEYVGQDIIVTDGTTLLGADNKAGVAEIVTAMEYLVNHPDIEHGRIAVAFTSDEEIGRGAALFDVGQFGCDWAYTVDGGALGELEYENFNAAEAAVTFRGRNVHPGTAKGKMVNAVRLAMLFDAAIPGTERPETTEKYEGFYHLTSLSGSVEEATAHYIIRDHDSALFNRRKAFLENRAKEIEALYPGSVSLLIKEQYCNMKEQIEPVMHVIETAKTAMLKSGVVPVVQPIRGGTDGAVLSYKGLPCPNIFAGGMNFHGKHEYLPVFSMVKACEVIVNIVKEVAISYR